VWPGPPSAEPAPTRPLPLAAQRRGRRRQAFPSPSSRWSVTASPEGREGYLHHTPTTTRRRSRPRTLRLRARIAFLGELGRRALLTDDLIALSLDDDPLDIGEIVPGCDDELVRARPRELVDGERQR